MIAAVSSESLPLLKMTVFSDVFQPRVDGRHDDLAGRDGHTAGALPTGR